MKDTMIIKIIQIEFIKMINLITKVELIESLIQLIGEWRHRLVGTLVKRDRK